MATQVTPPTSTLTPPTTFKGFLWNMTKSVIIGMVIKMVARSVKCAQGKPINEARAYGEGYQELATTALITCDVMDYMELL